MYVFSQKVSKEYPMNKKKAELISKIVKCRAQADNLRFNIDKCESILKLYNKKIVEKAVLVKDLENFEQNFVLKIVRKIVPKQERTIDDYFPKTV